MTDEEIDTETADREISLSPGIVLAVFLALALVCAVFFGFGYSVGRRSVSAVAAVNDGSPALIEEVAKPSPGSSAGPGRLAKDSASHREDGSTEVAQPDFAPASPEAADGRKPPSTSRNRGEAVTPSPVASPVVKPTPNWHAPSVVTPLPASTSSPVSPGSASMVQVAAFSHQQDADLVAGALRRRGYDVAIRQQSQDNLLHVQLGPFGTKKEADAMRQRLQADGYNAIVK